MQDNEELKLNASDSKYHLRHFVRDHFVPQILLPIFRYVKSLCFTPKLDRKALRQSRLLLKKVPKNERCFVLGNGPSLMKQDLRALKNESVIACNFFNLHPQCEEIAPKYYAIFDMSFTQPSELAVHGFDIKRTEWVSNLLKTLPRSQFLMNVRMRRLLENSEFNSKNIWYFEPPEPILPGLTGRVAEYCMGLHSSGNVIPDCVIRLAINMGFKKIYLLGCDADWFLSGISHLQAASHFYRNNPYLTKKIPPFDMVSELKWFYEYFRAMRALQKMAVKLNIEICNLSEDSLLDMFPRKTLDEVLETTSNRYLPTGS